MMAGIEEFLDMGGYARYVWPSYALVIGAIVLNIYWARRALKRARAEALRRLAIRDHATQAPSAAGQSVGGNAS